MTVLEVGGINRKEPMSAIVQNEAEVFWTDQKVLKPEQARVTTTQINTIFSQPRLSATLSMARQSRSSRARRCSCSLEG